MAAKTSLDLNMGTQFERENKISTNRFPTRRFFLLDAHNITNKNYGIVTSLF
jgi:hypothetical protein